ncbi:MAG: FlgD immunoglobulin-like domain containing protein, partial [Candidatus Poribacteria bacterium]|nr:FlgD immunoglobulin-like domain containing protein [Candidatus Poribacteria bacterium]
LGREVKTLVNTTQDAGYKSVIWNATNDHGKPVSAGVYLYQIQAGDYHATRKMVVLKQVGFSYYLLEGLNGG